MPPPTSVERFIAWLIDWRWPLLGIAVVASVAAFPLAQRLQFDRNIENMFAPNDPLVEPFRKFKRIFGGDELVLAAYTDADLMSAGGYRRVAELTEQLKSLPGVASVISLATTPLGETVVDPQSPLARSTLAIMEGLTISADRQATAAVCLLQTQQTQHQQVQAPPTALSAQTPGVSRIDTVLAIRRIVQQHDPSGVIAGEPVMMVDGFRSLDRDGRLLGGATTLLLVGTIILCFRSLRWVLIPIAVVQVTLLWTKAILVVADLRLTMISSMLTAIVTVVGIAAVLHLIVAFREERSAGHSPKEALRIAGSHLAIPIVWACLTDAAGFGSLMASRVGPVQDFGLMTALASTIVLACIVMLVPGMALFGSYDTDPKRAWGEGRLDLELKRLASWIEHRHVALWCVTAVASVAAALGCLRLEVETDFTQNFRADSPLVQSYNFIEDRLGGAGAWDVMVPAPAIFNWEFLDRVKKLEDRLRTEAVVDNEKSTAQPGLTKVMSLVDLLAAAPGARLADVETGMRLLTARWPQFVGALRGADPAQPDQHYLRVMLRARERQPAEQKARLIEQVEKICREEFPAAEGRGAAAVTGYFVLITNLIDSLLGDQWLTFLIASLGVGLMMLVAYRSLPLAVILLVPNALPVFILTGLVGWLGLKVNMGSVMIAAATMGLSVDSSVHYLTEFRRLQDKGTSLHDAIEAAHQSVGRAMVFTTLALVIGFSSLCLSDFVPTVYFGVMMSLTMLGGLAGNLVILPLLLRMMKSTS